MAPRVAASGGGEESAHQRRRLRHAKRQAVTLKPRRHDAHSPFSRALRIAFEHVSAALLISPVASFIHATGKSTKNVVGRDVLEGHHRMFGTLFACKITRSDLFLDCLTQQALNMGAPRGWMTVRGISLVWPRLPFDTSEVNSRRGTTSFTCLP
uniref:Uncharacterized protein n=1 Tax=Aegilops tauschii TaxID=37682 RepID=N1QR30_AEGTA